MNRHERRAQAARARAVAKTIDPKGYRWSQRADPMDPNWVLIEFRIPNGGMPEAQYTGHDAGDRLMRFRAGYMAGVRDGFAEREEN